MSDTQNDTKKNWTSEQAQIIAELAWTEPGLTQEGISEKVGVSRKTLYRYRLDRDFINEISKYSRAYSEEANPKVDAAIARNAIAGDVQAQKLFKQLRGELKEKVENLYPEGIPDRINITVRRATKNDGPDS